MSEKVTPQAPELEQAVIGAVLLDAACYSRVGSMLSPDHFYTPQHRAIWKAIQHLHERGEAIDTLTVVSTLTRSGQLDSVGGAFYISQLTNKVSGTSNVDTHARIIVQVFVRRRIIEIATKALNTAYDERVDEFDLLDQINEQMGVVNAITAVKDPISAAEVINNMVEDRAQPLYLHFGMGDLDRHVALGPQSVTVIGARPSVGKTTFVVNGCINIAKAGHPVLLISLEMNEQQLSAKIISALTGIDSERVTRNEINEDERSRIAQAAVENGAWIPRILIENISTLQVGQVFGIFERAAKRHGCKVVVIDYLQLIATKEEGRYEAMTAISIACKQAAKASGIRLIELCQLKRRDGADVDPVMSDLRESGQIEADGDTIILLGREKGSERLLVKVVKNKIGPIGDIELGFDLISQRIGGAPSFDPRAITAPKSVNPDKHIAPEKDDMPF